MNPAHGGNIFAISRERGWDWREVLDFSANINPLGPSPRVAPAIQAALERIVHYPEAEPHALRTRLAELWKTGAEGILPGNGATELLHFFARRFSGVAVDLLTPVFSEFHRAFPGARMVDALNAEAWPESGLTVVTQPLNPSGQLLALDGWLRRTDHPVLVDESFLDFTGGASTLRLLGQRPNLFVLRSLTKFYALPGLRIGALIAAPEWMAEARRFREPWQVNVLAEAAAMAAVDDEDHARRSFAYVRSERAWFAESCANLPGVKVSPGEANYLELFLPYPIQAFAHYLLEHKILIRDCSAWPGLEAQPRIRIAVRTRNENLRLLEVWRQYRCA